METTTTLYVDLDETLRLMKRELAREFPGVRFSVRRSRGTAHGYVRVSWTDGPAGCDVEAITDAYEGEGFDGMTDCSFQIDHVSATGDGQPVRVRYGTRGISCQRELSDRRRAAMYRCALEFGGWGDAGYAKAREILAADDATVIARAHEVHAAHNYGLDAPTLAYRWERNPTWVPDFAADTWAIARET